MKKTIIFLIFALVLVSAVSATTISLQSNVSENLDDASTDSSAVGNNRGDDNAIFIENSASYTKYSYLKFNGTVPSGATVLSANLSVMITANGLDDTNEGFFVRGSLLQNNESWLEETLNWSVQPTSFIHSNSSYNITSGITGWYVFNVTDIVKIAVDNNYNNYSIVLTAFNYYGSPGQFDDIDIRTKESAVTAERPILTITYEESTPFWYYVSTNGSDSNAGSQADPFLTIDKAFSEIGCGDNLTIMDGSYNDVSGSTLSLSGCTIPTTITAFSGRPQLSSFNHSLTWTNVSSGGLNKWRASLPSGSTSFAVFRNDTNESYYPYGTSAAAYAEFLNTAKFEGFWVNTTSDLVYLRLDDTSVNPNNLPLVVSSANIWNLDYTGSAVGKLTISGLEFKFGVKGIDSNNAHHVLIDDVRVYTLDSGIMIDTSCDNVTIQQSDFIQKRSDIWAWSDTYNTIANSGGIETRGCKDGMNISYNRVSGYYNGIFPDASASSDMLGMDIGYNYVYDTWDDGIEIEDYCNGGKIHHNNMTSVFVGISLIPTASSAGNGCEYSYNLIVANKTQLYSTPSTSYFGECYKVTGTGSADYGYFHHNTCYGHRGIYATQSNSQENQVWIDNIFYTTDDAIFARSGLYSDGTIYDNNTYYTEKSTTNIGYYWDSDSNNTGLNLSEFKSAGGYNGVWDIGSEQVNPLFTNITIGDYRPLSTSPVCLASSTGSYVGALPCYDAPPDPVTNLGNVSVTNESIYINWTNPTDYGDLNNTYIYLNGNFVGNISKDEDGWTNYSLINNTAYRFDVITTDNTGNLGTNGTITITTLQNTYYPPESGIFPEIVNNGRYTINFTFLQKPYFLYLNITGNNTGNVPMEWQWTASSSVSDLTCSGNENDNNYATYCRPASGNTDEHHINKTFYNHANYTDRELHGTIYFQARYNSYVTAYCYGSSSYQSIGTYYGGNLGDYVTVYQNFTIPEACRDESTIKMKYVFKSTYGSGYSFYFNDAEIYTVAPYYIQFLDTTIFNSTNATDTSFEMDLTGHGNNITGNKFNITYGTAGLSTFNYNVSYGFLYNKSINISILNSATNASLNPLCSFNGAVVYPSSAFIYYNSSLTNWLNCTLSGYASVSSYIYPTYDNLTLYMGAFDLNISIYDEQIDQLITNKSIYIYIIQGSYAANYSTSNGTLFLSALTMPTGSFEIRYGGLNDDYATRSYFVTLQNASVIELYTVLLNQSSLITFNVIDERGYPVTGAYLKVQRYFIADGAYKLVGMETIDDTGTAGMYLIPNTVPYIIYVEKDSKVVFLSTANKIFMDTIQIYASLLDNPLESFYKINQQLTSYLAYSNATKLLTYFWNDASGIVTTACIEVTYRGSTGIGTLTSSCTSAASGTIVLDMTGLMLNNTEYEAHGKVYTNTAYSEYITDFLVLYHAAGIYEALGKTGLFFSWFLIITMFFVGITIAFDVAVIYTALAMIVVTVIGSAWFSVGLIAAICLLGVLMAIASKRT